MLRYLLYSRQGHVTGRALGEGLGIPHGRDMDNSERYDYLIRWGSTRSIRWIPAIKTFNRRSSISNNTDKYNSLSVMSEAGVPTPRFNRSSSHIDFPAIGRSNNHMGGRDVQLYMQRTDIEHVGPSDYYVHYIPKMLEYRVHIIGNEVVKVSQKVRTEDGEYDPVVWNYGNGFTFRNPREEHAGLYFAMAAVRALDLDFGAVDLIIGEDNRPYVLEVNTAPGLDEPSLDIYEQKFRRLLEMEG